MPTKRQLLNEILPLAQQKYAIDIEQSIRSQGNPNLNQQLARTQQHFQRELDQRALTSSEQGLLKLASQTALGMLPGMSRAGEVLKYPNLSYLASADPTVIYRRQHKVNSLSEIPTLANPGRIMEFIGFEKTPMIDIDFVHPSHTDASYTDVLNMGAVEDRVRQYVAQNPESAFRLYRTPGGVRGWDLVNQATPAQYDRAFKELGVDPQYADIAQQQSGKQLAFLKGTPYEKPQDARVFASRISPKPYSTERPVDYVAQPIVEIAGSKYTRPNPINERLIQKYHDKPIQDAWLQGEAKNLALKDIQQDLKGTSASFQDLVNEYMKRR